MATDVPRRDENTCLRVRGHEGAIEAAKKKELLLIQYRRVSQDDHRGP